MNGPNPHLDTVRVDSLIGTVLFDSPTHPASFRTRLDLVERVTLSPKESGHFILDSIGDLQEVSTLSELKWFKSSFSEASGNACAEVAVDDKNDEVAIRNSARPKHVVRTSRAAFTALIAQLRTSAPG